MKHQLTLRNAKSPSRKGGRRYASPLRAEQAEQTKLRIMQAYGDQVCSGASDDITVQQVAARASVSVPTVYRNFASLDALADAYWVWAEPRIASFDALKSPDDLPAFAEAIFGQFAAREPLVRAMLETRAGRRLRNRTVGRRNERFAQALAPLTRRLPEREARSVAGVCKVLTSGIVWLVLRDDWGLDGEEAGRAASWALRVLIDALRKDSHPLKREKGSHR
jgi:AcrR family transcriptional regulator